jgi:SAM-dependent methyltransferase
LKILDFGCGTRKTPGAVGLDNNPGTDADIIHDLNIAPYPLPDDEFDIIVGNQVIEHVEDLMLVMAELYRVAKPGAIIKLDTPHFLRHRQLHRPDAPPSSDDRILSLLHRQTPRLRVLQPRPPAPASRTRHDAQVVARARR